MAMMHCDDADLDACDRASYAEGIKQLWRRFATDVKVRHWYV